MRPVHMTTHELEASLPAAGFAEPAEVRFGVLENTGKVSVIPIAECDWSAVLGRLAVSRSRQITPLN